MTRAMYKYLATGSLLLVLPACSGQAPTEAGPSIADSTMIQLLIELHLVEARANIVQSDESTRRDSILLQYGVEREAFDAAMDYYAAHPSEFVSIYSEALDKLSDERYMPSN